MVPSSTFQADPSLFLLNTWKLLLAVPSNNSCQPSLCSAAVSLFVESAGAGVVAILSVFGVSGSGCFEFDSQLAIVAKAAIDKVANNDRITNVLKFEYEMRIAL